MVAYTLHSLSILFYCDEVMWLTCPQSFVDEDLRMVFLCSDSQMNFGLPSFIIFAL